MLSEAPPRLFGPEGVFVGGEFLQQRDELLISRVSHGEKSVADESGMPRAPERRAFEALIELRWGQADEFFQIECGFEPRLQHRASRRELVPRAGILTGVAAENPVAVSGAELLRYRMFARLDREVGDAAGGVGETAPRATATCQFGFRQQDMRDIRREEKRGRLQL